jgi:glycosyltransferase involved in cell wall biosynthesis
MLNINLTAPINQLGYGVVGSNILTTMLNNKINVKLWPIGRVDTGAFALDEVDKNTLKIQRCIDAHSVYDIHAPSLRIWHQFDLAQHVGKGLHIGFPIFELDDFTNQEKAELNRLDILFVCSRWAKNVVEKHCPGVNIKVVPLGVNRKIFHENIKEPDPEWTTFINVGKWEYRKGHDILAEAFHKAFEPKDRVRLWMMSHNPFISREKTQYWEGLYKNGKMGHRVSFLPRQLNADGVANVMAAADCGVFPARAEGWNLELLEMMSVGRRVIATNYAGHTEFCNESNCYLLDVDNLERAQDNVFFDGKVGNWANLDKHKEVGQLLIAAMRDVYLRKQNQELWHNINGITTAKNLTWDNTTNVISSYVL